jgi:hypothetical protein
MYSIRPLDAWTSFHQASTTFHIYLKGRQRDKEFQTQSSRTRGLEQRLYWSCFKSEWYVPDMHIMLIIVNFVSIYRSPILGLRILATLTSFRHRL